MSSQVQPNDVFVVIPAYNEAGVVELVILDLISYGYKLVVVDDGSQNLLNVVLSGMPVYLLRHAVNLGQGAALQTGFEFALKKGAKYIVTFDADGQHQASDIPSLLEAMQKKNVEVILGSRFLTAKSNLPPRRRWLLQVARMINLLLTGMFLSDAHNGFRVLNRQAAKTIRLHENGMAHATEILWEIKHHKLKFSEEPVQVQYTSYSLQKGQNMWSGFRVLSDLFLKLLTR